MNDTIQLLETDKFKAILACLADGDFHSGEQLGELLGVSRAAVWKQLQKLQAFGIAIDSVKGRGYAIAGGLDLLAADAILNELSEEARRLCRHLDVFSVIDSTNAYLLAHADPLGRVCLAESQAAGRGRRGRQWHSPFGKNIYLSLGWEFNGGVMALEGLSLAIGLAVERALSGQGLQGITLKWPNDVLFNGQKLAGILVEMSGDPAGVCRVVIGIGLNVSMSVLGATGGDEAIDQPWTDVMAIAREQGLFAPTRNSIAAAVLNELLPLLKGYPAKGFAAYQQEWNRCNAFDQQWVELSNGNQLHTGVMLGVNEQGALRLQTSTGEELFYGGEVSVRSRS